MINIKESKYNIWIDDYPSKEYDLVFNTLQRSLLKLPKTIKNIIRIQKYQDIPINFMRLLLESNILMEHEIEEIKVFRSWFDRYRLSTEGIAITFIPTYSCNCRCVYCYEDGVRLDSSKVETCDEYKIEEIFNWIERLVKMWRPKRLDFCFHGGEPLLAPGVLEKAGKKVNEIAENYHLEKVFSVVTNATLLNDMVLEMLLTYSFNRMLCTIDGNPEIHNIRRPFLNGSGTFEVSLKNINRALNRGMTVVLGVNVDRHDISELATPL